MRLIDADALLKRKGCAYDSEGHLLFAVGTGDIVNAPTIDAIPVEWLCQKIREEREQSNILKAEYIKDLIWEYHQEQNELEEI